MFIRKFVLIRYLLIIMNNFHTSTQSGQIQISKILIVVAVVVLVLIIAVYGVTSFLGIRQPTGSQTGEESQMPETEPIEPPKPVYDTQLGDVRFLLLSAEDLGNIIKSTSQYEQDLKTTEKFIRVAVGAQNKGKSDLKGYSWDIGSIVDSEGRNFVSINDRFYYRLPKPDLCGAILKPEFEPLPCLRYYEVSKISTNLKVIIRALTPEAKESFLDLKLNQ